MSDNCNQNKQDETLEKNRKPDNEAESEHKEEKLPFADDTKIMQPPPGGPIHTGPETEIWMLCPEGCGYRRKLRQAGQTLFCKNCGSPLVLEDPM